MAGIGKTTLADAIFNRVSNGFKSSCFLRTVRESEERGTLLESRQKFLSTISEDVDLNVSAPTIGEGFLKDRLSRKKVQVVCDDVTNSSQLELLFRGIDRFGPGSRVIVTTRDKQVLIQNDIDLIYEVEELDEDESVRLFCQPIKVIGSSLYGKNKSYQGSAVTKLNQIPNPDIHKLLRSSFDGLDSEEKDMFLDIACFYKGEHRYFVTRIMDACYFSSHSGIDDLIDKSLISASKNKIAMHDLLEQMGRDIVRSVSPSEPGRRSRLWIPEDIYDVLTENSITFLEGNPLKTLPSLFDPKNLVELDMGYSHVELLWEGKQDLVYLKVISLFGSTNLVRIPDLSSTTNLESINFSSCTKLLELPSSLQHLEKLTRLNLRSCENLRSLPSFPEVSPNVREMQLGGTAIEQVPSSVASLCQLVLLSMNDCARLKNLPTIISNLRSLEALSFRNKSNITTFPEISGNIKELNLQATAVKEVPSWIGCLSSLRVLNLARCRRLKSVSTSIQKLKSLKDLCLGDCSRLEIFPEILDTMDGLRSPDLIRTDLKELPSSMENLIGLRYLSLEKCQNLVCLPDSFYKLKYLLFLYVNGCTNLVIWPDNLFSAIGGASSTSRPEIQKDLHGLSSLHGLSAF
ncbi:hypothetical protein F3Y22_tig00112370pilonHSYRG00018 [Hibiscus syriacus]|uniref:Uncharacterized protein n=1 Tax=Hibiscus syriacus TaxID=106335 RepID=A0A6A2Y5A0_HIBSY|nr:hypothetical protein F3Y22_tig00112370pilonHSYRG00018 [Hibiscus syriacus]